MYKKILVPLDGSKRAEAILPHVEELAQKCESQIIFVQIIEPPFVLTPVLGSRPVPVEAIVVEDMIDLAKKDMKGLVGKFREMNIKAKAVVETGPVAHKIMEIAERENADLIMMASHGRSGLARVFYGSVASSVLQRVDRPLLLIRAEGNELL